MIHEILSNFWIMLRGLVPIVMLALTLLGIPLSLALMFADMNSRKERAIGVVIFVAVLFLGSALVPVSKALFQ